jgi:hypothetical protein
MEVARWRKADGRLEAVPVTAGQYPWPWPAPVKSTSISGRGGGVFLVSSRCNWLS